MPKICFLDASVIADFLILKMALDLKKGVNEKLRLLKEREKDNPELFYSHQLLSGIGMILNNDFIFITSNLAISEVISVIHDKFCIDKIYEQGVPLKYWYKYREKFTLEDKDMTNLIQEILSFHSIFIKNGNIRLVEKQNIDNTLKIISLHKETHDSYLVSQAIEEKSDFFITKDTRLKEHLKRFKEIKIFTPKGFFKTILNEKPKYSDCEDNKNS